MAGIGTRTRLAAALAAALTALMAMSPGCGSPKLCEQGLCPAGTRCDADTGRCEPIDDASAALAPRLFGVFSALALPGLQRAFVGWVPAQQSLAYIERDGTGQRTAFIAGPAVAPGQPPAGRHSAAYAAPAGALHVAYTDSEGRLWYAYRSGATWQREAIPTIAPGVPGAHLAVTLWSGRPALLFDRAKTGSLGFVYKDDGLWRPESIHPPAAADGKKWQLTGRLAISTFGSSIAAVAHDRAGHNLVVAKRSAGTWTAAAIAGPDAVAASPGAIGASKEVGQACAVTRGLTGELVVAWRDAAGNRVMLARSSGGPIQHAVIADGTRKDADHGVTRRHMVGTDLAITSLPGGRLVLAFQDGSRLRIRVAVEQASGAFSLSDVPFAGRPQLAPRVVARVDGSAAVSWLELDPTANEPGGQATTWLVGGGGR